MFSGNRLFNAAVGGFLAVFLWTTCVLSSEPQQGPHEAEKPNCAAENKAGAKATVEAPVVSFAPPKDQREHDSNHSGVTDGDTKKSAEPGLNLSNWRVWVSPLGDGLAQWVMAFFGLVATVASIAGVILLWKTLKATRDTTHAAVASANATIATERARFFVNIVSLNTGNAFQVAETYDNSPDMVVSGKRGFSFQFKNFGKTPGTIIEIGLDMFVSQEPHGPVYDMKMRPEIGRTYGGGESTDVMIFEKDDHGVTVADMLRLKNGNEYIWVCGRLLYTDVFADQNSPESVRTHRFFRRVIIEKVGRYFFQPCDFEHYNESD